MFSHFHHGLMSVGISNFTHLKLNLKHSEVSKKSKGLNTVWSRCICNTAVVMHIHTHKGRALRSLTLEEKMNICLFFVCFLRSSFSALSPCCICGLLDLSGLLEMKPSSAPPLRLWAERAETRCVSLGVSMEKQQDTNRTRLCIHWTEWSSLQDVSLLHTLCAVRSISQWRCMRSRILIAGTFPCLCLPVSN